MLPDGPVITYQEEAWSVVLPELEACFKAHSAEVTQDPARTIPLDPDYASYAALEQLGQLSVLTARVDGELAGYFVTFVRPDLHSQTTLTAYVDVYYVKPGYRVGYLALGMFKAVEQAMRARDVTRILAGTKVYKNMGVLFTRLGWTEAEVLYSKWIAD
jgi:Acetyltransferase (GNAT) family